MSEEKSPFFYDCIIYADKISDSCAYAVPRLINKKEQLVIGILYTAFIIEKLAIHYERFDEEARKTYAHYFSPAFFWQNNFIVPDNIPFDVDKSYTQEHVLVHNIFYVSTMADIISRDLDEIKKWGAKIKALAYEYSCPSDLIDVDDANNFFEEKFGDLFSLESGFYKLCRGNDDYILSIKHKLEEIVYKSDKEFSSKYEKSGNGDLVGRLGNWLNKNL
tara:strand:- start:64 stop:720 length:657 start_codon:yes stop_codon:yes gene_type:complete